jgi:endonuclease/exonuclease/phosphatase family metal-dependent hydrolase
LKIATFNMWGGNPHQEQVTRWLRAIDADIVLLQEVPASYASGGFIELKACYPYQFREETLEQWWSNAVLSKYPLSLVKLYDAREGYFSTRQRIEMCAGERNIAVYNIHLTYPMRATPRVDTSSFLLRTMLRYDASVRNTEIGTMLEDLAGETLPCIAAGDFNMSAQSPLYRRISSVMHDSFHEAGHGFGGTWPISAVAGFPRLIPPLLRLDYVWHSAHFRAVCAEVGPKLGSDHLPVTVILENTI